MSNGGRCFQGVLRLVLTVLALHDSLATETASAKTLEYLTVLGVPKEERSGRTDGRAISQSETTDA